MFNKHPFFHELERITKAILAHNGESRIVGGSVRDALINKEVQDFDIATTLLPNETMLALKKANIKSIPTGIKYGTVSAVLNKRTYEITTLRRDVETYGRKAKVEYTDNWHEDAARRDFTINAMSYDIIENQLYDYYSGKEDLENGIVQFVGDPEKRVQEDYLRIIRFYRFQGKYGKKINNSSIDACRKFASQVLELSGERRHSELQKIMQTGAWFNSISLIHADNILTYLLGCKVVPNSISELSNIKKENVAIDIDLLIYILVRNNYNECSSSLKLSNKQRKYLLSLSNLDSNYQNYFDEAKKLIYLFSHKIFFDFVILKSAENNDFDIYRNLKNQFDGWISPIFPLNGDDIKRHFNVSGKEIGDLLYQAQEIWFKHDMNISKAKILALIA